MTENIISKESLISAGKLNIQKRIDVVCSQLDNLKKDIAKETKSSAGDKFETARAMIHIEQEKALKLLNVLKEQFHLLDIIDISLTHNIVGHGSVLITDKIKLFLSAPIGKLSVGNNEFVFLSIISPLAKAFKGRGIGESVNFNGQTHSIISVF